MDVDAAAAAVRAASRRLSVGEHDLSPAGASPLLTGAGGSGDIPPPPTDFNVLVRQLSESTKLSDVILREIAFSPLQVWGWVTSLFRGWQMLRTVES